MYTHGTLIFVYMTIHLHLGTDNSIKGGWFNLVLISKSCLYSEMKRRFVWVHQMGVSNVCKTLILQD